MAKISAHGCHKVAAFRVEIPDNLGADPADRTYYYRFVLRSDRKVLRALAHTVHGRYGWHDSGNLSIIGTLKSADPADLRTYLERRYGAENVSDAR